MKFLLISLIFFSQIALSATINLNSGDVITLQPNNSATVTCGMNANCTLPIKNLKLKFDYCKSQVNSRVEECLDEIWPDYTKKNPKCVEDAIEPCISFCKTSVLTLSCLDICK